MEKRSSWRRTGRRKKDWRPSRMKWKKKKKRRKNDEEIQEEKEMKETKRKMRKMIGWKDVH